MDCLAVSNLAGFDLAGGEFVEFGIDEVAIELAVGLKL